MLAQLPKEENRVESKLKAVRWKLKWSEKTPVQEWKRLRDAGGKKV